MVCDSSVFHGESTSSQRNFTANTRDSAKVESTGQRQLAPQLSGLGTVHVAIKNATSSYVSCMSNPLPPPAPPTPTHTPARAPSPRVQRAVFVLCPGVTSSFKTPHGKRYSTRTRGRIIFGLVRDLSWSLTCFTAACCQKHIAPAHQKGPLTRLHLHICLCPCWGACCSVIFFRNWLQQGGRGWHGLCPGACSSFCQSALCPQLCWTCIPASA